MKSSLIRGLLFARTQSAFKRLYCHPRELIPYCSISKKIIMERMLKFERQIQLDSSCCRRGRIWKSPSRHKAREHRWWSGDGRNPMKFLANYLTTILGPPTFVAKFGQYFELFTVRCLMIYKPSRMLFMILWSSVLGGMGTTILFSGGYSGRPDVGYKLRIVLNIDDDWINLRSLIR